LSNIRLCVCSENKDGWIFAGRLTDTDGTEDLAPGSGVEILDAERVRRACRCRLCRQQ
jgi:hypothetical protein